MFVRTQRLTLRPGWPEDAPALARAIDHEAVVRNLSRAPWPYSIEAAETFLSHWTETRFLAFEHQAGAVALVGCIGIDPAGDEAHELGYWFTPAAWGKGYATEAGRGVLAAARAAGIRRVTSGHFVDNPASGRVLRKLGFRSTGRVEPMWSKGRNCEVACARFERELDADDCNPGSEPRLAA
ncbi:GNAT family N-acetyltransferase [Sphingomonas sp. TDK1]|uniref:GNAT family N-acetyltransferase n=1 Tax=Sphingomonas sp. TDK1 TaxID=453247 RepID=UPI0007D94AC2|nr:GNAT family N-acetyltransferase [Sphingomonas sp. TDK1]OAN57073.1 GNAT family acetyltransferase [Sphingomonas sp. TDK1]